MDKKFVLITGVFLGMGIFILPTFVDIGVGRTAVRFIGGLVMMAGIIYFIAGDVIKGGDPYEKEIKRKLKTGEIDQSYAYQLRMQKLDNDITMAEKMAALEAKKAELNRLKNTGKQTGFGGKEQSFKMPDVYGNMADIMSPKGQQPPRQNLKDLNDMMGVNNHDYYDGAARSMGVKKQLAPDRATKQEMFGNTVEAFGIDRKKDERAWKNMRRNL